MSLLSKSSDFFINSPFGPRFGAAGLLWLIGGLCLELSYDSTTVVHASATAAFAVFICSMLFAWWRGWARYTEPEIWLTCLSAAFGIHLMASVSAAQAVVTGGPETVVNAIAWITMTVAVGYVHYLTPRHYEVTTDE